MTTTEAEILRRRRVVATLKAALENGVLFAAAEGLTPDDAAMITVDHDQLVARLRELFTDMKVPHIPAVEGWKAKEDVGPQPRVIDVSEIELIQIGIRDVATIVPQAHEARAMWGRYHAAWMLANQEYIPVAWREFTLVFPGTCYGNNGEPIFIAIRWEATKEVWVSDIVILTVIDDTCRFPRLIRH